MSRLESVFIPAINRGWCNNHRHLLFTRGVTNHSGVLRNSKICENPSSQRPFFHFQRLCFAEMPKTKKCMYCCRLNCSSLSFSRPQTAAAKVGEGGAFHPQPSDKVVVVEVEADEEGDGE